VPFTDVNDTVGAAVLIVMFCAPVVPVFVAVSVWVTVIVYVPLADNAGVVAYDHTPAEHAGVPDCVLGPVIDTLTVALSPAAEPHAPPNAVTLEFVVYGNVRAVPFTVVSVTTGAVLSTVIACTPLVPVLPAASD